MYAFRVGGEIFLSSVDNDGMKNGFPMELAVLVDQVCEVPVIISGGLITFDDAHHFEKLSSIKGISISRAKLDEIC